MNKPLGPGVTAEMARDARKADKEDRELIDQLRKLSNSAEWKAYTTYLNKIIGEAGATMLTPAQSMDNLVALEGLKGEMRGLIKARDLPSVILSQSPPKPAEDEDTDQ